MFGIHWLRMMRLGVQWGPAVSCLLGISCHSGHLPSSLVQVLTLVVPSQEQMLLLLTQGVSGGRHCLEVLNGVPRQIPVDFVSLAHHWICCFWTWSSPRGTMGFLAIFLVCFWDCEFLCLHELISFLSFRDFSRFLSHTALSWIFYFKCTHPFCHFQGLMMAWGGRYPGSGPWTIQGFTQLSPGRVAR